MKIAKIVLILLFASSVFSCKKYLNVSDELAGGLTSVNQVFENPGYAKRWYANVMSGVPDYSMIVRADWDGGGQTGLHNPWTSMTDEVNSTYGDARNYFTSDKNSSNMSFHRWWTLYQLIRQGNIFLEKGKPIPPSGTDADKLDEDEFNKMVVNVKFMRAYYHYLLFEQYGPIPIVDRSYTLTEDIDIPRSSVDEVVGYIKNELDKVIPLLPDGPITDEQLRANPTKAVAMAVKAKLLIYAASPLFNGGYAEAVNLKDKTGKSLFPSANASKWQAARTAAKELIDYTEGHGYSLYVAQTGGVDDPAKSVYEVFQGYNNEIIWATPNEGYGGLNADRLERRTTPRSEPNGLGSTSVVQELVDAFYMSDGKPIANTDYLPKSPLYDEEGFTVYDGVWVFNMFINREPRFYNTVFFAGRKWHISNKPIYFHVGSANDRAGQAPQNGYIMYKRLSKKVHKTSPGVTYIFRPSIVFRLAEFYLLYAEALNEVEPTNPDILKYVNKVRKRAGIPDLDVINPAIAGNQTLQRKAIQRESRIELATEGQRYFDVRRWMIAETPEGRQGGDFHGMNMNGGWENFFERTRFQTRVFNKKMYLYPIPFSEMQKSKTLVQNPGW